LLSKQLGADLVLLLCVVLHCLQARSWRSS
jgi:hypothetical protein